MNEETKQLEVIDLLKKRFSSNFIQRILGVGHLLVQKVIKIGQRTVLKTRKRKNLQSLHSTAHQGHGQQNPTQSCPLHE